MQMIKDTVVRTTGRASPREPINGQARSEDSIYSNSRLQPHKRFTFLKAGYNNKLLSPMGATNILASSLQGTGILANGSPNTPTGALDLVTVQMTINHLKSG
jgi:hypothetical protein